MSDKIDYLTANGCGKDYAALEAELLEALSRFSIYDYITPANLKEAEATFLEFGEDPVFEYGGDVGELDALEKWVRGLPLAREEGCWPFLARARDVFLKEIGLARAVGGSDFEKYTVLHTPPPTSREAENALKVLSWAWAGEEKPVVEDKTLEASSVVERFKMELKRLGMSGWSVVIGAGVARARVEASRKRVVIKGSEWFAESEIRRLVAHEIWGHALRGESGSRQPARVLGTQYLGGGATDEGIALHLEMAAGAWRGPMRAARHVVAVSAARGASFSGVYKAIRKYARTDKEAFRQVARVKRGLGDTSKPGGWTKDVIYFRGLVEMQRYFSQASYFDVECLYAGKFPLADCELVRRGLREGLLRTPALLPPPLTRENYKASLKRMREAYAATPMDL